MPEPFFTDHAWDWANDPEYRRKNAMKRREFIWNVVIPLLLLAVILTVLIGGVLLAQWGETR